MEEPVTVVVVDDERVFDFPALYLRTLEDAVRYFFHFFREECPDRISELWLDYDLGGSDEAPIDVRLLILILEEATFYDLPYRIDTIVICTDNPVGRAYIHAALDQHYNVIDIPVEVKWKVLKQ